PSELKKISITEIKNEKTTPLVIEKEDFDSLDNPKLFLNRELSWIKFNYRIFSEAQNQSNPILERIKFFAICGSNLDEFFMVRVAGLYHQIEQGINTKSLDGKMPSEQMKIIQKDVEWLLKEYSNLWSEKLMPNLKSNGIHICSYDELNNSQRKFVKKYFKNNIHPALTPMAFDRSHSFPFISNLSLNLLVTLKNSNKKEAFARIKIPTDTFPRFIEIQSNDLQKNENDKCFILLENLISKHLGTLFSGMEIIDSYLFRISRNADFDIVPEDGEGIISAVEDYIEERRIGPPVRLEVDDRMPDRIRSMLQEKLNLSSEYVYTQKHPIRLVDLWELIEIERPDLKDSTFTPTMPDAFKNDENLFSKIEKNDIMFYHPYDSFTPIVRMLQKAATDPYVIAIKITLYRIEHESPVIDALILAQKNGKQVTALVELKARFDEKNNITFAKTLEENGVFVTYGHEKLKVHAKICLIVRKKGDKLIRFVHLNSGSYNTFTSKIYGDIGYLTCDPEMGDDAIAFFNALTGYAKELHYKRLIPSPLHIKNDILNRIENEIENQIAYGNGYIGFKLNGLLDKEIIKALYRASISGVKIDLNVRGLCSLIPGIKNISENIRVFSIVGRFLEHARIYYFYNNGAKDVLIGSADLMPRNLIRRVEVIFLVKDLNIKSQLINILNIHFKDTEKNWELSNDCVYRQIKPKGEEFSFNSQNWFIEHRGVWHEKQVENIR
ncbi:MAG: polyphosphate kinase 1, partial [Methanosarcinaceae archaeon]|nr:polyphosphate kinase 1 [Methanosarcinaceae archaeon]